MTVTGTRRDREGVIWRLVSFPDYCFLYLVACLVVVFTVGEGVRGSNMSDVTPSSPCPSDFVISTLDVSHDSLRRLDEQFRMSLDSCSQESATI